MPCMRGSRNFRQGGQGQSDKKALTLFCFVLFCFFVFFSAYFTKVKWLFSKKTIIFQGSRGGPTFFKEGSNCLFSIETHITCDFPGGSGPPAPPPLDPHLPCITECGISFRSSFFVKEPSKGFTEYKVSIKLSYLSGVKHFFHQHTLAFIYLPY